MRYLSLGINCCFRKNLKKKWKTGDSKFSYFTNTSECHYCFYFFYNHNKNKKHTWLDNGSHKITVSNFIQKRTHSNDADNQTVGNGIWFTWWIQSRLNEIELQLIASTVHGEKRIAIFTFNKQHFLENCSIPYLPSN